MAYTYVNGTVNGGIYKGIYTGGFGWEVTSQDIANNTSTLKIAMWIMKSSDSYNWYNLYSRTSYYTIDGSTTNFSSRIDMRTASGTSANERQVMGEAGQTAFPAGYFLVKTVTITHNADGTRTVPITTFLSCNDSSDHVTNVSTTSTITLPTIPRATQPILADNSVPFGTAFSIGVTPATGSFTHTLTYTFGTQSGTIATLSSANPISWTAPNALASEIPTVNSGSGTITCQTYNGATLIGTKSVAFTLEIPTTWKPVLTTAHSGFSWVNSPANLTGYVIQNISTLTLTLVSGLNSLVSAYGTTIGTYQVRFASYNSGLVAYSNSAVSKSAGLITVSGNQYAFYKVMDARGNWSNEVSEQIMGTGSTIYPYSAPANNGFNVARNATVLTSADFQMNFSRSSINNANTWSYRRQYYNGSSWVYIDGASVNIPADTITSTLTHSLPYSEATVYQVRVLLTDLFTTNIAYEDTLPTSDVPLVLTQYGAGIGKIPTAGGTYDLEVGTGGISSEGDIVIPNTNSYDFEGTNATIRSNGSGALVLAGTDVYIRPNGDVTTNQLLVPDTGNATHNGNTIWTAGNDGAGSTLDADLLDGNQTTASGNRWGVIPVVGADGVLEAGKYLDFHETDASVADYSGRLESSAGDPFWNGAPLQNIEASGSNANGYYVKYSDGTMICYGTHVGSYAITTTGTFTYYSAAITVTFAQTFYSVATLSTNFFGKDATSYLCVNEAAPTTSSQQIRLYRQLGTSATATRNIGYIAIGRWKA